MQTRVSTKLTTEDMAMPRRLADAFNLVGGKLSVPEEDHKPFSRIAGNDFSVRDVQRAVDIIRRRRRELYANCEEPIFHDAKLQATFAAGIKANADHAVRLAEEFLTNLREDMMAE